MDERTSHLHDRYRVAKIRAMACISDGMSKALDELFAFLIEDSTSTSAVLNKQSIDRQMTPVNHHQPYLTTSIQATQSTNSSHKQNNNCDNLDDDVISDSEYELVEECAPELIEAKEPSENTPLKDTDLRPFANNLANYRRETPIEFSFEKTPVQLPAPQWATTRGSAMSHRPPKYATSTPIRLDISMKEGISIHKAPATFPMMPPISPVRPVPMQPQKVAILQEKYASLPRVAPKIAPKMAPKMAVSPNVPPFLGYQSTNVSKQTMANTRIPARTQVNTPMFNHTPTATPLTPARERSMVAKPITATIIVGTPPTPAPVATTITTAPATATAPIARPMEELVRTVFINCIESTCSETFPSRAVLTSHLSSEHGIARYQCPLVVKCGQSCDTEIAWLDHLASHWYLRVWECYACPLNFTNGLALDGHITLEHGEGLFECTVEGCPFSDRFPILVTAHCKAVHGIELSMERPKAINSNRTRPLPGGLPTAAVGSGTNKKRKNRK